MTGSPNVSTILDAVNLSGAEKKEVEASLVKFVDLKEDEKEAARPAVLEKIFSSIFKNNAHPENSTSFDELRKSPW